MDEWMDGWIDALQDVSRDWLYGVRQDSSSNNNNNNNNNNDNDGASKGKPSKLYIISIGTWHNFGKDWHKSLHKDTDIPPPPSYVCFQQR
eukprot:scaffold8705_cov140-Amphora_coffeaeformis.AAC.3